MFVLVLAGVAGLTVTGWLVTRQRYVDDEVNRARLVVDGHRDDVLEVAGAEPPASAHVRHVRGTGLPPG